MFPPRPESPLGGTVPLHGVGDDPAGDGGEALEPLTEEPRRAVLVPPALPQNLDEMSVLIHRAPERRALRLKGAQPFLQGPLVSGAGLSAPELMRIRRPTLAAPLANRVVSHRDTTCPQPLFAIAITEAETHIEPTRRADEVDRQAVVRLALDGWGVQAPSTAHQARARHAAQQGDNAMRGAVERRKMV
jgi:hypothetical protein